MNGWLPRSSGLAAFLLNLGMCFTACAQHGHASSAASTDGFNPKQHPNPALAEYYKNNETEIDELVKKAKDSMLDQEERLKALSTLRSKYPDHAVSVAIVLIKDDADKVAALSADIAAAASVMMDHEMPVDGGSSPAAKYEHAKHHQLMEALRAAVVDKREEVRTPAAKLLAAQSDEAGLSQIAGAAEEGVYTNLEAVNYLGLASPATSGQYLAKFLDEQNEEVQAAAASYLSYAPAFREQVRDEILLNPDAKLEVRQAAAQGLARDANAALPILADPTTPPALRETVLEGYVKARGRQLSQAQLQSFSRCAEGIEEQYPEATLDDLKGQLDRLYESKSQ